MNTCTHPSHIVIADILEGDSRTRQVNWCQHCGAYRIIFKITEQIGEWKLPSSEAPPSKETLNCPKCMSNDVDKMHHASTFALPECWYWWCNDCQHEWDHG